MALKISQLDKDGAYDSTEVRNMLRKLSEKKPAQIELFPSKEGQGWRVKGQSADDAKGTIPVNSHQRHAMKAATNHLVAARDKYKIKD